MADLNRIKELVFESDNTACFIERERTMSRLEKELKNYTAPDKYALIISRVLAEASVPLYDCDLFAGRVVEAKPDEGMNAPSLLLKSTGHMSFDYAKLLKCGLKGILEEIKETAAKKGDDDSAVFAKNAEIVVNAVKEYCDRYALAAKEAGREDIAKALGTVPYLPAYDFFSALQGMWIIHMIASCYVGSRDYAFGRFDKYMLPYYEEALKSGKTEEELTETLAYFIVKTNEICGRCAHDYKRKLILSAASKQYICIGGKEPNAFSRVVLNAAKINNMAQPQIVVLLDEKADGNFTDCVFDALSVLKDKMNIFNYPLVTEALIKKGIPREVAEDHSYSACCTFDLHYHNFRMEYYINVPQILLNALNAGDHLTLTELLEEFKKLLTDDMQKYADEKQQGMEADAGRRAFVLDSILLSDSAKECRYACDGNAKYNLMNMFIAGIATVADSIAVLDRLVFKEKRYTCREFAEILNKNYEGYEELLREIQGYTKFGNDTEADSYATLVGNICLDAADDVVLKDNFMIAAGFYSLQRENLWAECTGATPDGRKAGEPFSENQSPTYGADKNGITALLKSISKLPLRRTVTGGLNLTFSQNMSPEILKALTCSYFSMGGLHVGISVVNRATLQDAMVHPEKYKSLTVRLYGFSDYFVALAPWQQQAILNRTAY